MFVPVPAERSPGKSPEQDNMDFLMQESCSNKSLPYYRDMLRMFMAGSPFEVMQHASMHPSLEQGRLSRHEQQCCQGFDFVEWQLYCDRSESSPPDQGFATNQGSLAAVWFLSSTVEARHTSEASTVELNRKRNIHFTAIGMGRTCNQGALSSLPL